MWMLPLYLHVNKKSDDDDDDDDDDDCDGHSVPSSDSRRAFVNFWLKNVHNTG